MGNLNIGTLSINTNLIVNIVLIGFIAFILMKIISKMFKKSEKLYVKFIKSCLHVLIGIIALVCILNHFEGFQTFSATILTSSSLLVVVLGFAFQTSLSDFIAGIFISFFRPFDVNDRITLKSTGITGTIENITMRHTVVRTFTNSRLIIPNSIMNQEIIENSHMIDTKSANFIDVLVDFRTDIDLAKEIIKKCIEEHPDTINPDGDEDKNFTYVFTREFGSNGIWLRASVWTSVVDISFKTCSEIRDSILREFHKNNIYIPYQHMEIIQK